MFSYAGQWFSFKYLLFRWIYSETPGENRKSILFLSCRDVVIRVISSVVTVMSTLSLWKSSSFCSCQSCLRFNFGLIYFSWYQNLREAIVGYRNSIQRQADEKKREAALSYFVEYLERYYFLICFAVYIHTDQSALLPDRVPTFQQWMRARPELYSILRR